MKRNRIILSTAALATLIVAGGCADDTFDSVRGFNSERDLKLTLRLPAFTTPTTRAVDDEAIKDVMVYFYGSDGQIGDPEPVSDFTPSGADYVTHVLAPAGTTKVELIANYDALKLDGMTLTADPNDGLVLPFYGETAIDADGNTNLTIDMVRSCAKTTFSVASGVTDFKILGTYFYNNPKTGLVNYDEVGTQKLPKDIDYEEGGKQVTATPTSPYYHYEAEAGKCYWLIHAEYKGEPSWFKLAYILNQKFIDENPELKPLEGKEIPLLRNHHYAFTVNSVNHGGFASREEAETAPFENRLSVELSDHEENIYDLISCGDYYVGVQNKVTVPAEAEEVVIDVVTNYTGGLSADNIFITKGEDHILSSRDITVVKAGSTHDDTEGTRYTVTLPLYDNTHSSEDFVINLQVRVGDLTCDVAVTQLGYDFFNANSSLVIGVKGIPGLKTAFNFAGKSVPDLFLNSAADIADYFAFLDSDNSLSLKGESPEEMGIERGEGLHFPVYVGPGEKYLEYYIPTHRNATSFDGYTCAVTDGSEYVTVTPDPSFEFFHVTLTEKGKNSNYQLWTATISYSGPQGEIDLDVYHTGIIHYLEGNNQVVDPDGKIAKGWFYYEMVDVIGKDGKTYHILDRNLGASSNKPYSYNASIESANVDARGGYFHVPGRNGMSDLEKLLPSGFNEIPARYHLDNWGLDPSPAIPAWNTTGNSAVSKIYLPVSGMVEGTTHGDEAHAYCWSSSMIMGTQGFFPGDPEYGYWYRALDIYGKDKVITPVRISSRANGAMHGYPVRPMSGPEALIGYDLPEVVEGRSRVILLNPAGWLNAQITTEGSKAVTDLNMSAGDEDNSWFYADLRGTVTSVRFKTGGVEMPKKAVSASDFIEGIATFSNSGIEAPDPDSRTQITLILLNGANWDDNADPKIYMWNKSNGNITYTGSWPGKSFNQKVTYDGQNAYRIDLKLADLDNNPSAFDQMNFILSEKGRDDCKSGDIQDLWTRDNTHITFVYNNNGFNFVSSSATAAVTTPGWTVVTPPEPDDNDEYYTFYVYDETNLGSYDIYYWHNDNSNSGWDNHVYSEGSHSGSGKSWQIWTEKAKIKKDGLKGIIIRSCEYENGQLKHKYQTENFEDISSLTSESGSVKQLKIYWDGYKRRITYIGNGKP